MKSLPLLILIFLAAAKCQRPAKILPPSHSTPAPETKDVSTLVPPLKFSDVPSLSKCLITMGEEGEPMLHRDVIDAFLAWSQNKQKVELILGATHVGDYERWGDAGVYWDLNSAGFRENGPFCIQYDFNTEFQLEAMAFLKDKFDRIIVDGSTVDFLRWDADNIKLFAGMLKPGGSLIVSIVNKLGPVSVIQAKTTEDNEVNINFIPPTTGRFVPDSLKKELKALFRAKDIALHARDEIVKWFLDCKEKLENVHNKDLLMELNKPWQESRLAPVISLDNQLGSIRFIYAGQSITIHVNKEVRRAYGLKVFGEAKDNFSKIEAFYGPYPVPPQGDDVTVYIVATR